MRQSVATFAFILLSSLLVVRSSRAQETTAQSVTRALACLSVETKAEDISPAADAAAKRVVIDAIGCALAGRDTPGVREVFAQYREWGGKPEATIWFHGDKLPRPEAAFVNSVQLHAMDLDECHFPSDTHMAAVVVPAVLAAGEFTHASGKETLAATILGIEVAGRIGRVFKAQRTNEGFLPSSVVGGFGATAAACRLQRLSVEQTVHALGIFYAHASGNRQALFDRTLTKRIQPAIAARAAVLAACLAERGVTGPERVLEGEASLLEIYAGSKQQPPKAADLPKSATGFEVELIWFKKYASCGRSHLAIDAAIALANEHNLKPDDIAEIELFGVGVNSGMVGVPWDPNHPIPHVLAQFCAPYEVATAIKNRRMGAAEVSNERIQADHEVSELALRTRLRDPKEFGGKYPGGKGGKIVRIRTKQGQTLVALRKGVPSNLSEADLIAKFKENAAFSGICPPQRTEALLKAIQQLDQCNDIARFIQEHLTTRK
jgi:2-methylcitrate dehydratase PrpD